MTGSLNESPNRSTNEDAVASPDTGKTNETITMKNILVFLKYSSKDTLVSAEPDFYP